MSSDESDGEEVTSLDEIATWLKDTMIAYLQKRGLPKSGNKKVLARRIHRQMTGIFSLSRDISYTRLMQNIFTVQVLGLYN